MRWRGGVLGLGGLELDGYVRMGGGRRTEGGFGDFVVRLVEGVVGGEVEVSCWACV